MLIILVIGWILVNGDCYCKEVEVLGIFNFQINWSFGSGLLLREILRLNHKLSEPLLF